MKLTCLCATVALFALTVPSPALGAPFALHQVFRHPAPDSYDGFGRSVALVDGKALVGAYCSAEVYTGSAFLFDPSTGDLLHTFTSPAPAAYDYFGWCVAAAGENVLIGAYGLGAAYLFDQDGILLQTYLNPRLETDDKFGWSVAAVGDKVLIGAPENDTGASNAGAAYLFDASSGALLQTFLNPAPAANDYFGRSVAGVAAKALIGSYPSNAAYLFDGSTGELLHTLQDPSFPAFSGLGFSVAGVGNNALIGAPWGDSQGVSAGIAHLFDGASGELLLSLHKPDPQVGDGFGRCVTSAGTNILVSAPYDDTAALDGGAVFLFDGATGDLLQAIPDPEPIIPEPPFGGRHYFGDSVSATDSSILAGASGGNFCSAGRYRAAYLFLPASPGDADLDGAVTLSDLGVLAHNWQQSHCGWGEGDFNADGSVNLLDLTLLAGNWETGRSVPEPAALLVLTIGALMMIRRRRVTCRVS